MRRRPPALLHLGQVCVDMTLDIDHLPGRGGDIFADSGAMGAGGGFNVLYAARQMGAPAMYMGASGTGPMASIARRALDGIGVPALGAVLPDLDTGVSVAMVERSGERTFVSTRGAETRVPEGAYEGIDLVSGDVVYLCGYSLMHPANTEAIRRFAVAHGGLGGEADGERDGLGKVGRRVTVLFDPDPVIGDVSDENLNMVRGLNPIWTLDEREAGILCERFGLGVDAVTGKAKIDGADDRNTARSAVPETMSDAARGAETAARQRSAGGSAQTGVNARCCRALAEYLHAQVIVRVGAGGAWYGDGTAARASDSCTPVHIPALHIAHVVDTNGAGDTHAGVLAAALLQGRDLPEAIRLANCAAGLSVTRSGPATCPSRPEIEAAAKSL